MARYVAIPAVGNQIDIVSKLFIEHVVNTAPALTRNATGWRAGQRILEAFESEDLIAKLKDEDHKLLLGILEGEDVPVPEFSIVIDAGLPTEKREATAPPRARMLLLCDAVAQATDERPDSPPALVAVAAE